MTCTLVTPWWRPRQPGPARVEGSVAATRILNWGHPRVDILVAQVRGLPPAELLRTAHHLIARSVRPVYAVDDTQPISRTLARGRGSCSQRLAVLEGVARASGIATRVRGLLVDGRFWYPRFRRLRLLVPNQVLLAWPEFRLADTWLPAAEIFGNLGDLSRSAPSGFTNSDSETLFDAISRTAIDWDGLTCAADAPGSCDLSATIRTDLGRFSSRDALFHTHGQTLCWPLTKLADPVLSRWSPT